MQLPHASPVLEAQDITQLLRQQQARIDELLQALQRAHEQIQQLRDEIAILKGQKARPKFKSSKMDQGTDKDKDKNDGPGDGPDGGAGDGSGASPQDAGKSHRAGSAKRSKTAALQIHEERVIAPALPLPAGARFKGYRDFVVQGLIIKAHNIRYRLESWRSPHGSWLKGQLPLSVQGHHFDVQLRSYVLHQHHHCHVTQPLLLEQLRQWGIDISAGQIEALLSAGKEPFHEEKAGVLSTGLQVSPAITVDDSGARHQGKNGYVLHIGNALFGWFGSTASKSRINFLEQLHAGTITTRINEVALDYMHGQGLSALVRAQLALVPYPAVNQTPNQMSQQLSEQACPPCLSLAHWQAHLASLQITDARHVRTATEGALLGSLMHKGFNPELVIVSDGARQFAIGLHALCWIHAERLIHQLIPINQEQRQSQQRVRAQLWDLYADLKAYKRQPEQESAPLLQARFDALFTQSTGYYTLDDLLARLYRRKPELLLVLQRPEIPLHTNGSETDIRDYVKKRKVSGGTRSDRGRQCRDTFASLKKTCRKLGISFWLYLLDRLSLSNTIPPLPALIRQAATAGLP